MSKSTPTRTKLKQKLNDACRRKGVAVLTKGQGGNMDSIKAIHRKIGSFKPLFSLELEEMP